MDKLTGKFDALDSRLDSLEEKRNQLEETIGAKQAQTPLGRLNKVRSSHALLPLRGTHVAPVGHLNYTIKRAVEVYAEYGQKHTTYVCFLEMYTA
jgi:hypothetical protein